MKTIQNPVTIEVQVEIQSLKRFQSYLYLPWDLGQNFHLTKIIFFFFLSFLPFLYFVCIYIVGFKAKLLNSSQGILSEERLLYRLMNVRFVNNGTLFKYNIARIDKVCRHFVVKHKFC